MREKNRKSEIEAVELQAMDRIADCGRHAFLTGRATLRKPFLGGVSGSTEEERWHWQWLWDLGWREAASSEGWL